MALADTYVQVYGQLPTLFKRIAEGQAPAKFTTQYLKDIGFISSNFRAAIPLLKALGFLSADGVPTSRYHEYRNSAQSRRIMGAALKEAYGDVFTIKANPGPSDRKLIEGKFKSAHNASENTSKLMASTFYALLGLADLSDEVKKEVEKKESDEPEPEEPGQTLPLKVKASEPEGGSRTPHRATLHYNIQIHLPATKDVEVFNAIFKALKDHLLE